MNRHQLQLRVGLCINCKFVKQVDNRRGSSFFLCKKAETNPSFSKYPVLPVYQCSGFEPSGEVTDNEPS